MKYRLASLLFILLFATSAHAVTVVRMQLLQAGVSKNIDIKLFDEITPNTVNSFLRYTDTLPAANAPDTPTESYNNSFIHGIFIAEIEYIVGGRFSYTDVADFLCDFCDATATAEFPGGLQRVTLDAPLAKEVVKPNLRGMIAMELDNNLSSASTWHINLIDNIDFIFANLFAVFGEIINGTMATVDGIATEPMTTITDRSDIHFEMAALPLTLAGGQTEIINIREENLTMVSSVKKLFTVNSDVSASITADTDFGVVSLNADHDAVITIENVGENDLTVAEIGLTELLDLPFSFPQASDNCTGMLLNPAPAVTSTCTFMVRFNAAVEAESVDTFNIEFTFSSGAPVSYSHSVAATAAAVIQSIISLDTIDLDLGVVLPEMTGERFIRVTNTGTTELLISAIEISGVNASEFELAGNCSTAGSIAAGAGCSITVRLTPQSLGKKTGVLTISSNDPDQPAIEVGLEGLSDTDFDTIAASIEQAAPNAGDNNADELDDSLQSNVASFVGEADDYVSLVVDSSFIVTNISVEPSNMFPVLPEDVVFRHGVFTYQVFLNRVGGNIQVGIVLPEGQSPETYYLYGETEDNMTPHWYPFTELTFTTIQLIDDARIPLPNSGGEVVRNLIRLTLQDGGPGDADNMINGQILIGPGAVAYSTKQGGGSGGSINYLFLILFTALLLGRGPLYEYLPR